MVEKLYRVSTPYFVAGLTVAGGKIVDAPPIMKWTIGFSLDEITHWVKTRGGTVKELDVL